MWSGFLRRLHVSAHDPWQVLAFQVIYHQARLIASLREQGVLVPFLSLEEAADVLWALTSFDLSRMLVVEQRWEPQRYETWLAQLLAQQLLAPRLRAGL